MAQRALRIATILIIIQSFLFFPTPVSHAQDNLTQAELILAQTTAELFLKRLDETGDFSTVINEMYAEDFIERYIQQQIREGKESDSSSNIYFLPRFVYKRNLLKQATVEDWRRLYIADNNFTYHIIITSLNKHADDLLNGRKLDDERFEKCIPAKVLELFNNHPILKGFFGLDDDDKDDKSGVGEPDGGSQSGAVPHKRGPKSIETPEEMQGVTETFQEGLRLLLDDQGDHSPRLTETAKSALEVFRLKLNGNEGGVIEPRLYFADKEYLGLPPGTRILIAATPIMYRLAIAQVGGKYKIVQAEFVAPCSPTQSR
jgi:hypothetical protein